MRTEAEIEVKHATPALLWRKGEMYDTYRLGLILARPIWNEFSTRGKWHLADASGRYFEISHFERIKPFDGIKTWWERMNRHIFAVPILTNARQLSLEDFKKTLELVAWERYRHDSDLYDYTEIQSALPKARSYVEAIEVLTDCM